PKILAEISEDLGDAMFGLEIKNLEDNFAERGW
ncbi:MAG: pyridoxal 5'-phosphate synthase lyase subunit PdxS, partial [Caloramator sp.]|nr:pyridoxal 5'-phosphate synthase lyase subunit PdxS [Caloramator sp.]